MDYKPQIRENSLFWTGGYWILDKKTLPQTLAVNAKQGFPIVARRKLIFDDEPNCQEKANRRHHTT